MCLKVTDDTGCYWETDKGEVISWISVLPVIEVLLEFKLLKGGKLVSRVSLMTAQGILERLMWKITVVKRM